MVLCFILCGIVVAVATCLFYEKAIGEGIIATFIALFILGLGFIFYDSKMSDAKIKALNQVGIEYLSKEDVYNKSQADLDKLFKVTTLSGTYYYYELGDAE